jgi:two-component system, sensor histidine kinase and response regulator
MPSPTKRHGRIDALMSEMLKSQRLAGVRILFAEDNEVNQLVMQAMLRPEGPELTTVADGRLAVEQIVARGPAAFDIVLMDVQMPVMDGYEATRRIREISPDLPVIGQTAHVLQDAIQQCQEAGMVAHISKPIDRNDLVTVILRHARSRMRA